MSEHEHTSSDDDQPDQAKTLEDLDMPEGQSQDVGGGTKVTMTDLIVTSDK
jgi:hypothetical protein